MRAVRFLFLLGGQAVAFQAFHPAQSALARPGLHHASIQGRFVDSTGEPVADVIVQVAGNIRSLPVASVRTDAEGRFSFPEEMQDEQD